MSIHYLIRHIDWYSLILMLLLVTSGLVCIASATYTPGVPLSLFFKKQLFGVLCGLLIYAVLCFIDVRTLAWLGYYGYCITLLLLIYTIAAGWLGMGAQRWISLYFFRFQPSELTKFFFPLFVAYHSDGLKNSEKKRTDFSAQTHGVPLAALMASVLLIIRQPDLGTGLIVLTSGMILIWLIGLDTKFFIYTGIILLLFSPLLWQCLKPYQRQRIMVSLGYGKKNNERYQIEQSKIAIGSGGVYGKGYLQGTQNRFKFIPEHHTDFIFAVLCEEWGLIGSLLILILFCLLFIHLIGIAARAPIIFDQIIGFGLLIPLILGMLINVGMVIALLPTTGIPLPFLSYGITHLWSSMATIGVLNGLAQQKYFYKKSQRQR